MAVKILGAALIFLGGVIGSFFLNKKADFKAAESGSYLNFFKYIREQIASYAMPITEILNKCDRDMLSFCGYPREEKIPADINEFLSKISVCDAENKKYMVSFSENFGKNSREDQIKECDYYINIMNDKRKRLYAELPNKKKVNSTLCISASLAVALLML